MTEEPKRLWLDDAAVDSGYAYTHNPHNQFVTEYVRADLVPQWQTIETAPKDGTSVLVWARWDWDGMAGDGCSEPYDAQVAHYEGKNFFAKTFNPYVDIAVNPTHWMPIPNPPNVP